MPFRFPSRAWKTFSFAGRDTSFGVMKTSIHHRDTKPGQNKEGFSLCPCVPCGEKVFLMNSIAIPAMGEENDELLLPAFTLWWREVVRFYRQRTRVVGVIASPILFWLVIGSGFGNSFQAGGSGNGQHYLDYSY